MNAATASASAFRITLADPVRSLLPGETVTFMGSVTNTFDVVAEIEGVSVGFLFDGSTATYPVALGFSAGPFLHNRSLAPGESTGLIALFSATLASDFLAEREVLGYLAASVRVPGVPIYQPDNKLTFANSYGVFGLGLNTDPPLFDEAAMQEWFRANDAGSVSSGVDVPEPGSALLLLSAAAVLCAIPRRRRNRMLGSCSL